MSRRVPLAPIHPSHGHGHTPKSIPSKRPPPSPSPSASSSTVPTRKSRKIDTEADWDATPLNEETVRKVKSRIWDKTLFQDGKSPARRLFVDLNDDGDKRTRTLSGISGAIPTPPSKPTSSSESINTIPPTSPIPQQYSFAESNNIPIWDCGFTIYADETATDPPSSTSSSSFTGLQTPKSRRTFTTKLNTLITSSVKRKKDKGKEKEVVHEDVEGLENYDIFDDQENIPPPIIRSSTSTPSKLSSASTPSTRYTEGDEEEVIDVVLGSGGGGDHGTPRRRKIGEKSKLGLASFVRKVSEKMGKNADDAEEEEEELTPGRRDLSNLKEKGKARLTREVDEVL